MKKLTPIRTPFVKDDRQQQKQQQQLYHDTYKYFYNQLVLHHSDLSFPTNNYCCWCELDTKYKLHDKKKPYGSITTTPRQFTTANSFHWIDPEINSMQKFDTMFLNYGNLYTIDQQPFQIAQYAFYIIGHLNVGGNCVLKVDLLTDPDIIKLIYYISTLFNKPFIIEKPDNCNRLTHERFIVLKDFRPISSCGLNSIDNSNNNNIYKNLKISNDVTIPLKILNHINESNSIIGSKILNNLSHNTKKKYGFWDQYEQPMMGRHYAMT